MSSRLKARHSLIRMALVEESIKAQYAFLFSQYAAFLSFSISPSVKMPRFFSSPEYPPSPAVTSSGIIFSLNAQRRATRPGNTTLLTVFPASRFRSAIPKFRRSCRVISASVLPEKTGSHSS